MSAPPPAAPTPAARGRPPQKRCGDLLLALSIALVVALVSLPGAVREEAPFVPRFVPLVLDPNHAPVDDLRVLPGIGRVLADRIAAEAAREPFRAPEDLLRVHGIGPRLLARTRPHLRFGPPPPQTRR